MTNACPCGSEKEYADCCSPLIKGEKPAPTAEALMRSRYTAYVLKDMDYLKESLAPEALEGHDDSSVKEWAERANWLGLEVHETWAGGEGDESGIVEFSAQYAIDDEALIHRERGEFKRIGEHWRYVDGTMVSGPPVRKERKIGRNEPCPCGSGKKYKKCCAK
ncbi:YchJ family protein [Pseudodesulfovibrio piezophilus]|uniref:YchJ-like middle NTF2-like domain-containing protein n=1 Tax=Pseudodesulfovibrio piezophilus (strain DSM 21447 / JCM 15486 / C1TLV30) TaxID=1322246 RepID=M1WJY9_PSEP2|nr:YchJ family protein [Pseudodesulfovibrio piezophilus]CCH48716.1 conserved protein of unknown function [Pseudodesulfovibrio piezophilus C1TLV30]